MNEFPETRATGRHNGDRSPDEIVADLDHTRARMDADLAALQDRLSPGYLMDEVLRFVRQGGAAEYFRNLGETAKRNPVPLALVSTGLAWLALSSGRGQPDYTRTPSGPSEAELGHSDYPGAYSPSAADLYTGDPDVDLLIASEYEETSTGTGEGSLKDKARSAAEGMKQSAQGAKARAGAAVESAKDRMHDVAESARHGMDTAKSRMHGMSESARHGMESAREQARIRARRAREQARRARDGTSRFIHEQPLAAAGIGLAIGAMLGGLLPGTRREDQLMGRSSDRLKQQAEQQASAAAGKGREALQSATESAHHALGGEPSGGHRAGSVPGESAASAGPRSVTGNESLREGEERAGRVSGDAVVGVTEVEVVTGAQGTDVKPGTDSGRTRR